jgi:hypothetical protein
MTKDIFNFKKIYKHFKETENDLEGKLSSKLSKKKEKEVSSLNFHHGQLSLIFNLYVSLNMAYYLSLSR